MTLLLAVLLCFAGGASAQQVAPIRVSPVVPVGVAAGTAASLRLAPVPSVLTELPTALNLRLSPAASFLPAPQGPSVKTQAPAWAQGSQVPAVPAASPKPLRLVIAGPPGAGKTTYGKRIAQDYGVVHISVGELLRASAQTHPELAAAMAKGELLDTGLVLGLVKQRLEAGDVRERGFILDGFPRRMEEARALEAWLSDHRQALDAMIFLDVPDDELRRRILARGRADDTEEVFRGRMDIYHCETEPVLRRLSGRTAVLAPDISASDIETNYSRIQSLIESALRGLK
ncbi:MAG: nucleoside monophosphate kinase [Elusimicrobia bacterium]|nr:nucleoside monophosphate kinase [Elusimicrobiota bacterium]